MMSALILATSDSAMAANTESLQRALGNRERDHLFWGEQGVYFEITIRGQENY